MRWMIAMLAVAVASDVFAMGRRPQEEERPAQETGRTGEQAGAAQQREDVKELAQDFNVNEGELASLRDKGLSWSDIGHTVAISDRAGIRPSEVADLKQSGLSWEQVARRYGFEVQEVHEQAADFQQKAQQLEARYGPDFLEVRTAGAGRGEVYSRLAERYDVSEDELQRLREEGMGWGEIGHAVAISNKADKDLSEVVQLRKSGLGWNEISQRYGFELNEVRDEARRIENEARDAERETMPGEERMQERMDEGPEGFPEESAPRGSEGGQDVESPGGAEQGDSLDRDLPEEGEIEEEREDGGY